MTEGTITNLGSLAAAGKGALEPAAPATSTDMPAIISALIEKVAESIEEALGIRNALAKQGGPYETSLTLKYERDLRQAAANAIHTIVSDESLRPQ